MSRAAAGAVALALALGGCGSPGPEEAVDTAERWLQAVAGDRAGEACELMLPTASRSLELKYVRDLRGRSCEQLVRGYRDRLSQGKLDAIADDGFEFEGDIKNDRLGVFPATARYELEVLLMEIDDAEWKVASVGLDPDRP